MQSDGLVLLAEVIRLEKKQTRKWDIRSILLFILSQTAVQLAALTVLYLWENPVCHEGNIKLTDVFTASCAHRTPGRFCLLSVCLRCQFTFIPPDTSIGTKDSRMGKKD